MLTFLKRLLKIPSDLDVFTGTLFRVTNKDSYQTANKTYWCIRVRKENIVFRDGVSVPGRTTVLLLTDHEIDRARNRAAKNPEDISHRLYDAANQEGEVLTDVVDSVNK